MKIKLTQILTIVLINSVFFLLSIETLGLSGCSSSLAAHSPGSPTVADAYTSAMRGDTSYSKENSTGDSENSFDNQVVHVSRINLPDIEKAQIIIHKPIMDTLNAQFPTLSNPQSKMYVFGHFAGDGRVPVAGHFVPFSLYTRNYYALPNEVLMPYNDGQFVHSRSQFNGRG